MSDYAYDDDVLEEVARRLYAALPAMYRVADEPRGDPYEAVPNRPQPEPGDLRAFLEVLAAPLAVLRQSIQELHADLFIDTADDRIVPYLAEMVGTTLVFPDAASNRRDVRGTVGWRRRKGTPSALEEMGAELTAQPVVLQEGWKRIQLAQDLNLLRAERVSVDIRPSVVAEQATGPLDTLFHTVDVRPISARTGRRHPRHVAHWVHPTVTFPLEEATAAAGGWQLNGILTLRSGVPFTPALSNTNWSRSGNTSGEDRPNLKPGTDPDSLILGGPDLYFDPSGFVLPAQGFFGNAGRNSLTGPGLAMMNLALVKNTNLGMLGSAGALQLRLEVFNLFNRANFAVPNRVVFAAARADEAPLATAGRITRTITSARQFQLGVKVLF